MRTVNEIICHCSATPEGKDFTVAQFDSWHKKRGWSGIGYHWVVYLDGSIHKGRSEAKIGAHVAGRNSRTIGICYVGGVSANDVKKAKDTRTPEQKAALVDLIKQIMKRHPSIKKISGHHDYASKACPCFPARKEYAYLTEGKVSKKPADKSAPIKPTPARLLKVGSRSWEVKALQKRLTELGYHLVADGIYGRGTKAAVLSFQSDMEIGTDGMVGPLTRAALDIAVPVDNGSRSVATAEDLKGRSRIVRKGSSVSNLAAMTGIIGAGGKAVQETGILKSAQGLLDQGTEMRGIIESASDFLAWGLDHWWILIPTVAAIVWWKARGIIEARVEDHRSSKTV